MARRSPDKHHREGITLAELFQRFPDDATAEKWFVECRWENGTHCAYCDSENVNDHATHATMPYRCNDCKKRFSVQTNSVMQASNLGSDGSTGLMLNRQIHADDTLHFRPCQIRFTPTPSNQPKGE